MVHHAFYWNCLEPNPRLKKGGLTARQHIDVFLILCYGIRRDLHSFPTRRSSDLPSPTSPRRPCEVPPELCWLDRKSTRLNSSHQIISYAVFCLKKKNRSPQIESSLRG